MNILICDNDNVSSHACEKSILNIAQAHEIPVSIHIVENANQLFVSKETEEQSIDLIYLEANLQKHSGFAVAKQLREEGYTSDLVFYTNDEDDVIRGYDVDAMHYVLKEKTTDSKFTEIFLKAAERARKRDVEVISLACAGVHKNVPVQDILYFSVLNRITTVCYRKNDSYEKFEFYSSLSKIEEFLYKQGFVRIHGSYLVAKTYVQQVSKREVTMRDGAVLPIGRTYTANVRSL